MPPQSSPQSAEDVSLLSAPPPPLPPSLSSRLQSTINPLTGRCKFHPTVQLCSLVQNSTRWVVRRKICYKCGSRPLVHGSGSRHKPGVCVSNPAMISPDGGGGSGEIDTSGRGSSGGGGVSRRSRSASVDRASSSSTRNNRGTTPSADRRESRVLRRRGSSLRDATGRSQSATRSSSRGRSQSATRQRMSDVLAASNNAMSTGTSGGARGRSSSRGCDRGRGTATPSSASRGRSKSVDVVQPAEAAPSSSTANKRSSFHGRALEFTHKVMTESNNKLATSSSNHPNQDKVNEGAISPYTPPPVQAAITPQRQITPPAVEESTVIPDFDESDPIIMIPSIIDQQDDMPPPPPRTAEELQRHRARLEMRRDHIRKGREERRRRRLKAAAAGASAGSGVGSFGGENDKERKADVDARDGKGKESAATGGRERKKRWDRHRNFAVDGDDTTPAVIEEEEEEAKAAFAGNATSAVKCIDPPQDDNKKEKRKASGSKRNEGTDELLPHVEDPPPQQEQANSKTSKKAGEEVEEEPILPSPVAMALLDLGNHPAKRKSERKVVVRSPAAAAVAERAPTPPPSSQALTLLESKGKKSDSRALRNRNSSRRNSNSRRGASAGVVTGGGRGRLLRGNSNVRAKEQQPTQEAKNHEHDDAISETSELSFGTAKFLYAGNANRHGNVDTSEHIRRHPELEGVALPEVPTMMSSGPPADVTVDRSRSLSRSRKSDDRDRRSSGEVCGEDPPSGSKCGAPAVNRSNSSGRRLSSRRSGSSRALATRTEAPVNTTDGRKPEQESLTPKRGYLKETRSSIGGSGRRTRSSTSRHLPHQDGEPRQTAQQESLNKSSPAFSSTTRSNPRVWDVRGNDISSEYDPIKIKGGGGRRRYSSASRLNASAGQAARSSSPTKGRTSSREKIQRSKSLGSRLSSARKSKEQEGERSRHTNSTHPESTSSDDRSPHHHTAGHEEEGEPEPMIIYKKRASKRNTNNNNAEAHGDNDTIMRSMTMIACSSDEKSHASSISSGSAIEYDDDETQRDDFNGDAWDEDDENGDAANVKDRAMLALNGVKGGARRLGTRGKRTLGGLRGTSKKWQSALFM